MSSIQGKEVVYAVMHGPIHTPQAGHLKQVLKNTSDPENRAVKMKISGDFVVVTATNPATKKSVEILVPLTGFTHLVLADQ